MSCCGQKRRAFKAFLAPRPVRLRFIGQGTIHVRGVASGKTYVASPPTPEIDVDPRDANAILQTGGFVKA